MKRIPDDYEDAIIFLLKELPASFIHEVKLIFFSNNNIEYARIESLIIETLQNAGFKWGNITMHMKWKEIIDEVIRRREEICCN
jgi:hypothetical protein